MLLKGTVHIYQNESSSPQNRKRCLHFKFYYILAHCNSSGRYCPSYLLIWLNSHKHHQIFTPSCCVHLIKTDVEIENVLAWIRSTVLLVSVTAHGCDLWLLADSADCLDPHLVPASVGTNSTSPALISSDSEAEVKSSYVSFCRLRNFNLSLGNIAPKQIK